MNDAKNKCCCDDVQLLKRQKSVRVILLNKSPKRLFGKNAQADDFQKKHNSKNAMLIQYSGPFSGNKWVGVLEDDWRLKPHANECQYGELHKGRTQSLKFGELCLCAWKLGLLRITDALKKVGFG